MLAKRWRQETISQNKHCAIFQVACGPASEDGQGGVEHDSRYVHSCIRIHNKQIQSALLDLTAKLGSTAQSVLSVYKKVGAIPTNTIGVILQAGQESPDTM